MKGLLKAMLLKLVCPVVVQAIDVEKTDGFESWIVMSCVTQKFVKPA